MERHPDGLEEENDNDAVLPRTDQYVYVIPTKSQQGSYRPT